MIFFLQRIEIYTFFFVGGGGSGMEEVVWRGGSMVWVSEFFLQMIQIYKKQVSSS